MAEYIGREALIKKIGDILNTAPMIYAGGLSLALTSIRSAPAADVALVVRCKDCRHRDPEDYKCDSGQPERQGCPFPVDDDYFCAYGEK